MRWLALLGPNGGRQVDHHLRCLGLSPTAGRPRRGSRQRPTQVRGRRPESAPCSSPAQASGCPRRSRRPGPWLGPAALPPAGAARPDRRARRHRHAPSAGGPIASSGGQAQRVRLPSRIAGDPDVVFLDEPTSAMDVESRQGFWRMMRNFGNEGRTVVFATHHLDRSGRDR